MSIKVLSQDCDSLPGNDKIHQLPLIKGLAECHAWAGCSDAVLLLVLPELDTVSSVRTPSYRQGGCFDLHGPQLVNGFNALVVKRTVPLTACILSTSQNCFCHSLLRYKYQFFIRLKNSLKSGSLCSLQDTQNYSENCFG